MKNDWFNSLGESKTKIDENSSRNHDNKLRELNVRNRERGRVCIGAKY